MQSHTNNGCDSERSRELHAAAERGLPILRERTDGSLSVRLARLLKRLRCELREILRGFLVRSRTGLFRLDILAILL